MLGRRGGGAGTTVNGGEGIRLRQAALVAGFAYLLNPVTYAEFFVYPKLVVASNADQTVQNISVHLGLFTAAIVCYLGNFVDDVVMAWALYLLLTPVNRALSLLAAWFQLVYAAVGLCAVFSLLDVYHLVSTPYYLSVFGSGPLHAQVWLLVHSFHFEWSLSLILFGIHLMLLGWLIYRSGYIPWVLGMVLFLAEVGWMIDGLGPYVVPHVNLRFTFVTALGELAFMLWLLIKGWKLKEAAVIG